MGPRRSTLSTDSLPAVFIDSSVFFTAVNSPTGGSAKVFSLSKQKFNLVTSPLVLAETERNVRQKLYSFHLERFFRLTERVDTLKQAPNPTLIKEAQQATVKKDAVILAEARQAKTVYLLTLDKKHLLTPTAQRFIQPTEIVTPKMLLES